MRRLLLAGLILALLILPAPEAVRAADDLTLTVTLDKTKVDVSKGETITANFQAKGGTEPYSYMAIWYIWDDDTEDWVQADEYYFETNSAYSFQPKYGASGYLSVQAQDKNYNVTDVGKRFDIIGSPKLILLTLTASVENTVVDFYSPKVGITYNITGGRPPYILECKFAYENQPVSSGEEMTEIQTEAPDIDNTAEIEVVSTFTSGTLILTAVDADNRRSSGVSQALTSSDPNKMTVSMQIGNATIVPGGVLPISWSISGGAAPYTTTISWLYVSLTTGLTAVGEELSVPGTSAEVLVPDDFDPEYGIIYWVDVTDQQGRVSGARTETYTELSVGSSGQDVLDMKQRFYELGYFRTNQFNDRFTDNTADTVKLFEGNNSLPVDGVADAQMLGVLFSDSAVGK